MPASIPVRQVMGILSRPGLPDAAWVQGLHLLRIYTEHPELLKELHCAVEDTWSAPLPPASLPPGPPSPSGR